MGTKQNSIHTGWQKNASASNLFVEWFHSLTVVQHDNVKFSENAQEATMLDYLPYPELIQQTHRCSAEVFHIADSINHE